MLFRSKCAIVDQADYEMLRKWPWRAANGYCRAYNGGGAAAARTAHMHRVIMLPAPGLEVDHTNGDGYDNRRANLRVCTHAQNIHNMRKPVHGRLSPFKGVDELPSGMWRVRICVGGARRHVGCYPTEREAARAYDTAAIRHFGPFAKLNLPDEEVAS